MKNNSSIVLMYHSIDTAIEGERGNHLYCISLDRFREQMQYLKRVTIPYIITFDDGDITNYTRAYPILKELGLKAHFFILAGKINTPGYLSWEEIKELHSNGMTIGSHGITHKIMLGLNQKELDYEITESKNILEKRLGFKIDYFSIPRGFYNKNIIDLIKGAGYKAIFTSSLKDHDDFKIGRIAIKGSWDLQHFTKALSGSYSGIENIVNIVKSLSRRILGIKQYDKLRSVLIKK